MRIALIATGLIALIAGLGLYLSPRGVAVSAEAEAGAPVAIPADWPLKFAQPPSGSHASTLTDAQIADIPGAEAATAQLFNEGTINEGRVWGVNFAYGGGWESYIAALEPGLLRRGYYLYWEKDGEGREYISKSGKHIVQLLYFPDAKLYKLSVMQYTNPWPHAEPNVANT